MKTSNKDNKNTLTIAKTTKDKPVAFASSSIKEDGLMTLTAQQRLMLNPPHINDKIMMAKLKQLLSSLISDELKECFDGSSWDWTFFMDIENNMSDEQRVEALKVVDFFLTRPTERKLKEMVSVLFLSCELGAMPPEDITAKSKTYVERLKMFPADILNEVLVGNVYEWLPKFGELHKMAQDLNFARNGLANVFAKRKPKTDEDRVRDYERLAYDLHYEHPQVEFCDDEDEEEDDGLYCQPQEPRKLSDAEIIRQEELKFQREQEDFYDYD